MKPYNFLNDNWDGNSKTVWSRKKQDKLFNQLIEQYPSANDLRKKLLSIGTEESVILAYKINPKWNDDQYHEFILSNIIRYSNAGKVILSQLIGSGIGTLIGYGVNKYIQPNTRLPSKKEYSDKIEAIKNDAKLHNYSDSVLDAKINEYTDSVLNDAEKVQMNKAHPWREVLPYGAAIGTKGLTAYGVYKFLNAIDKKPDKKNA